MGSFLFLTMVTIKEIITVILLLSETTALRVSDENIEVEYSISSYTECLDNSRAYAVRFSVSLGQCVKDCGGRSDCLALNYMQPFHLCKLFLSVEGDYIKSSRQTGQCLFIEKRDMKVVISSPVCNCQNGKKCDKENNICVTPVCPRASIENAVVFGNMNDVGSKIRYKCRVGYVAKLSKMYATCLGNETWSYQPECTKAYACYMYSNEDMERIAISTEAETCEYLGNVFTRGNNGNYPGCNTCWCCRPVYTF